MGFNAEKQRSREAERFEKVGDFTQRSGEMDENEISGIILDAAIMVHNELGGPGAWRATCLNNP